CSGTTLFGYRRGAARTTQPAFEDEQAPERQGRGAASSIFAQELECGAGSDPSATLQHGIGEGRLGGIAPFANQPAAGGQRESSFRGQRNFGSDMSPRDGSKQRLGRVA